MSKIPQGKKLVNACPSLMKQTIQGIVKEPSFWQRHKRKIIGGIGIAAGASILYGLYSWYYSAH